MAPFTEPLERAAGVRLTPVVGRALPRDSARRAASLTDGGPERGATAWVRGSARRAVAEPVASRAPLTGAGVPRTVPRPVLVCGAVVGVRPVVGTALRVDEAAGRRAAPETVGEAPARVSTAPRGTAARVVVARTGADDPVDGTADGPASPSRDTARRVVGSRLPGCRARRLPETSAFDVWLNPRGSDARGTALRATLTEPNSLDGTIVHALASPDE